MQYALPEILFSKCHKYCAEDTNAPLKAQEKTCIENCQAKTYSSFDIYMEALTIKEKSKGIEHFVDISKYTGFEVEHKEDTNNWAMPRGNFDRVNVEKMQKARGAFNREAANL
jgi:hypothetical protein